MGNLNKENNLFGNVGRFPQKSEGSTAGRLPTLYEQSDTHVIKKHSTNKKQKTEHEPISVGKTTF